MHAERLILETVTKGRLFNLPLLPPSARVEAIFLMLEEDQPESNTVPRRRPHPDLVGHLTIHDDFFDSAPVSAWNLPT